jgi:hypothetical protein
MIGVEHLARSGQAGLLPAAEVWGPPNTRGPSRESQRGLAWRLGLDPLAGNVGRAPSGTGARAHD